MNCKPIVVCASAVLALVGAARAMAADTDAQERAAKKACLLGDVEKGANLLADLYVSTNNPTYIYNQGRCFEQNGKNADAVLRFKEYLRKSKSLPPGEVDAIRKRIDELEAGSGAKTPQPEPAAATPQPATLPPAAPLPAPAVEARETSLGSALDLSQPSSPPEPPADVPLYKRWWFWTGVGALVAGGVVTAILLSRKSTPTSPACEVPGATCVSQ